MRFRHYLVYKIITIKDFIKLISYYQPRLLNINQDKKNIINGTGKSIIMNNLVMLDF